MRFRAKVVDALASSEFSAPFAGGELERLRQKVESSHRELVGLTEDLDPEQLVKDLGRRLFDTVFSGTVRDAWIAKTASSRDQHLVLRLLLHDPELVLWPWEYLRDAVDFLSLYLKISIVRYPLDPVFIPPLPVKLPFRILGVISSPKGCAPLSGGVEWKNLNESLAHLIRRKRVVLELLERPTLASLHDRLSDPKRPRCHAVHFIGHGGFERDKQGQGHGGLFFEDENGHPDLVAGEELGTIFAGRDLRLVVLNACNGARSDPANLFSSVAQVLIRKGVAGVVAMRYAVDDLFAVVFAGRFYRRLADGYSVEMALTETRSDLFSQKFKSEWGNPVLDLRSSDGRIFVIKKDPPVWIALVLACLLGLFSAIFSVEPDRSELSLQAPSSKEISLGIEGSRECPSPSGLDMKFILVRPGRLPVGERRGKRILEVFEPYCISVFEITRSQWSKLMGGDAGTEENLPASGKSHQDAEDFIAALNQLDPGGGYRLPSGDEWEFAHRAGRRDKYSFGDDVSALGEYGNCQGSDDYDGLAPVGQFKPNDLGLYDMTGNVWEWTADSLTPEPEGEIRWIRMGGSWRIQADRCTADYEASSPPLSDQDDFGFRIVRKPVPLDQNKGAA